VHDEIIVVQEQAVGFLQKFVEVQAGGDHCRKAILWTTKQRLHSKIGNVGALRGAGRGAGKYNPSVAASSWSRMAMTFLALKKWRKTWLWDTSLRKSCYENMVLFLLKENQSNHTA